MRCAEARPFGQRVERHRLARMGVEVFARALDGRRTGWLDERFCRLAPKTRAKPCGLGLGGRAEELDVFSQRMPRGARRPTENAGRADGGDESSVETGIASQHGTPGVVVADGCGRWMGSESRHGCHDLLS